MCIYTSFIYHNSFSKNEETNIHFLFIAFSIHWMGTGTVRFAFPRGRPRRRTICRRFRHILEQHRDQSHHVAVLSRGGLAIQRDVGDFFVLPTDRRNPWAKSLSLAALPYTLDMESGRPEKRLRNIMEYGGRITGQPQRY